MITKFLDIELVQARNGGEEYFLKEIKEAIYEKPGNDDVFLQIIYEGKIYQDDKFPKLESIDYSENLKIFKNSQFFLIHENILTKNNGYIEYTILKNLDEDEDFFLELYSYTLGGIFLAILFSLFIARRFMKKLIPQLQQLESINEKINFNTFKIDIDRKDFYKEFFDFLSSYESMLERLKQGAEKQTDFINSASHEIKTPLSIIKGYSDILKKRGQQNPQIFSEAIDTIQEEVKNMNHLVEKLLFISKHNEIKLSLEKISLTEIIQEVILEMDIIYPNQKIFLHSKNLFINSDWNFLKLVIRNLVDNSIKYGKGNPINIYLQDRGETAVIYIRDMGVGISKKNLKNIFDRFYRVDKSRSKEIGGHGLGLSIVKTILEALNGNIEIKSVLDEKTEVFLTFKKF